MVAELFVKQKRGRRKPIRVGNKNYSYEQEKLSPGFIMYVVCSTDDDEL